MQKDNMPSCAKECRLFVRRNWPHFLLLVPGAIVYTVTHEAVHALAVIVQGGRVTEFVWIPSGSGWGHIRYDFQPGIPYSALLISVAPYIMSVGLCVTGSLVGIFCRSLKPWIASTVFIWLFVVPLADLAYATIPYVVFACPNDLFHAFGPPTGGIGFILGFGGCVAAVLGYLLQKRLYGQLALSGRAYLAMALLALVLISSIRPLMAWFT